MRLCIMMFIILSLGGLMLSCGDTSGIREARDIPAAEEDVSLSKQLMPIFEKSCTCCHNRETPNKEAIAHKVYFETPADILGEIEKGYLIPEKPAQSDIFLLLKQEHVVGDQGEKIVMPPPRSGFEPWLEEELGLFKAWVIQGCSDN